MSPCVVRHGDKGSNVRDTHEASSSKSCTFFSSPAGCKKGSSCPFTHTTPVSGTPARLHPWDVQHGNKESNVADTREASSPNNCTFFSKSCTFFSSPAGCKKGSACPFTHATPGTPTPSSPSVVQHGTKASNATTSDTSSSKSCTFFSSSAGCKKGSACPFTHTKPGTSTPSSTSVVQHGTKASNATDTCDASSSKSCTFFSSSAGCKKGSACPFTHTHPGTPTSLPPSVVLHSNTDSNATSTRDASHKGCTFFSSPAGCKKGPSCPFAHTTPAAAAAPTPLHPCVVQHGNCRWGPNCRFARLPGNICIYNLRGECKHGAHCNWKHAGGRRPARAAPRRGPPPAAGSVLADAGSAAESDSDGESATAEPVSPPVKAAGGAVAPRAPLAKEARARNLYDILRRVAGEFARGKGKPNVVPNPVVATGGAYHLFAEGLRHLGYTRGIDQLLDTPAHYTLGFHGTKSTDAICGIFESGFDPSRRSGQVYGPGEYFDIATGVVSDQYSGSTACSIVALIVTKDRKGNRLPAYSEASYSGNPIAVVNNDKASPPLHAFCMPCAVASTAAIKCQVGDAVRAQFADELKALSAFDDDDSDSESSVSKTKGAGTQRGQLHVEADSGWVQAPAAVQSKAAAFLSQQKTSATGTSVLAMRIEVAGGTAFDYRLDFTQMQQTNTSTGKVRRMAWR
ncbi:Zinc finger CCCH domain-containing protein 8 [Diplonema papillatum]|nr:Zinc finger CCCH domain-containing protein 8 [Diplonema papillatum]